ncbi:MAG: SLC13 family permease [Sulfobacillus thermotolerans]|uniref:Tyrosine transporter P-protein n=1 Tax=Sulfobacillus thermotolerans TaxID=338644 RepID=A0ABN5H257_9FIRM|nr:tyrosine transporter P-protein [Sulfobacillus thermotolerans]MCY0908009.1 SLC13 family permease [Sulfobacillus thermotolerans]
MTEAQISLVALLLLYIFLIGDWFHRAWAALGVALLLIVTRVITVAEAVSFINFNTVGLLTGMMVLVGLLGEAGLFYQVGRVARRLARGRPVRLLWIFFVLTAFISAFLDNVTTILLLSPALFGAANEMDFDPVPFLMIMVAASNLGGLATLIGDPPNILIGTAAHLSFNQFARLLTPPAILLLVGLAAIVPYFMTFSSNPLPAEMDGPRRLQEFPLESRRGLLLTILAGVLVAFVLQREWHLAAGTISMAGAALGMLATIGKSVRIWNQVDWGTLGFFIGIFILVGALEHGGVIAHLAKFLAQHPLGQWMPLTILVGSALFSALLDNVPLVAAMIPLVQRLGQMHPEYGVELWAALALGAAIGGNATIIGASANVVAQGMAEERGYRLEFRRYLPFGLSVFAVTLVLGIIYVMLLG